MKYMAKSKEFGIREEQGGGRKENNILVEVGKKVDQTLTGLFSLLLVYLSITLQNKCTIVLGPLPMLTISKTKTVNAYSVL